MNDLLTVKLKTKSHSYHNFFTTCMKKQVGESSQFMASSVPDSFLMPQPSKHKDTPDYTPQPDIVHEIIGHVPMFADKDIADLSHKIGLISLGASDDQIKKLGGVYFFTIQFGVCNQNGANKAYGAGLASCIKQIMNLNDRKTQFKKFDAKSDCLNSFKIHDLQSVYYVTENLKTLLQYAYFQLQLVKVEHLAKFKILESLIIAQGILCKQRYAQEQQDFKDQMEEGQCVKVKKFNMSRLKLLYELNIKLPHLQVIFKPEFYSSQSQIQIQETQINELFDSLEQVKTSRHGQQLISKQILENKLKQFQITWLNLTLLQVDVIYMKDRIYNLFYSIKDFYSSKFQKQTNKYIQFLKFSSINYIYNFMRLFQQLVAELNRICLCQKIYSQNQNMELSLTKLRDAIQRAQY